MPTETEIYILADGQVVIADLPAELASLVAIMGTVEACEVAASVDKEESPPPHNQL